MINMLIEFFKRFRKKPKPDKPKQKAPEYYMEYHLTSGECTPIVTKPQERRPLPKAPPPYPDHGYQARSSSNHQNHDDSNYIVPLVVAAALFSGDNSGCSSSTSSNSPAFD